MILYTSTVSPHSSTLYRIRALQRLGEQVAMIDVQAFLPKHPLLHKIAYRLAAGPWVTRLNEEILRRAQAERPRIFWADKVLWLLPSTLEKLRAMSIITVGYMPDNPFGPRRDPGWRLFWRTIPEFDLHVVPRECNIAEYKQCHARDVMTMQFAYEPTAHYAPPAGWSDADRDREVSFIGSPYDDRAELLRRVGQTGVPLVISGSTRMWAKKLSRKTMALFYRYGELSGDAYREGIWRSKINLSFITRSNRDEVAHKSFEVAACGGFLLAERSAGHLARFVEDEEAVFFTGYDELLAKIARYLPDEAARSRIAAAGQARAACSGYDNDTQMRMILDHAYAIAARHQD